MYELITGKHPVMLKGEDKGAYRKRMRDFQAIPVGKIQLSR